MATFRGSEAYGADPFTNNTMHAGVLQNRILHLFASMVDSHSQTIDLENTLSSGTFVRLNINDERDFATAFGSHFDHKNHSTGSLLTIAPVSRPSAYMSILAGLCIISLVAWRRLAHVQLSAA